MMMKMMMMVTMILMMLTTPIGMASACLQVPTIITALEVDAK